MCAQSSVVITTPHSLASVKPSHRVAAPSLSAVVVAVVTADVVVVTAAQPSRLVQPTSRSPDTNPRRVTETGTPSSPWFVLRFSTHRLSPSGSSTHRPHTGRSVHWNAHSGAVHSAPAGKSFAMVRPRMKVSRRCLAHAHGAGTVVTLSAAGVDPATVVALCVVVAIVVVIVVLVVVDVLVVVVVVVVVVVAGMGVSPSNWSSAQHRTAKSSECATHCCTSASSFELPPTTQAEPKPWHRPWLHTSSPSRPHPVDRATSCCSSSAVHRRAPSCAHSRWAWG